ncbi:MAG: GEVED domain-containing protein [Xenococcaceae cyanobacterium]
MYAAASSNYGAGFLGSNANINYGSIGGAESVLAAGTVYKMDAVTGAPAVFVQLPQQSSSFTHTDPESSDSVPRTTGPGLGNIHHDKVHDQFFVSNFEDGRIYRVDSSGNILDSYDPGSVDGGSAGRVSVDQSVYGLTVSPDGTKLFFGRNDTVYSTDLNPDGSLSGSSSSSETYTAGSITHNWTNYSGATETAHNTVPDAGNVTFGSTSVTLDSIISDLDFLPTGELIVGTRVYDQGNLASSYNHGGHNYILEDTTTPGIYADRTEIVGFSTSTQNAGDDGYGGIGYSKQLDDSYDYVFSSSDILEEQGPHGIAIFPDNYTTQFVTNDDSPQTTADGNEIVPRGAISYGGITNDAKGVGGDVDVFNPGSIQGNVSEDTTGDGNGDTNLSGVTLTLYDETGTNPITDVDGNPITTTTDASGNYVFDNIFPGDYTVVQTQPVGLASLSETEGGTDGDNPLGDNTVNNQISVTVSVEENDLGNNFIEAEGDYGDAPDTTAGNGAGDYTTTEANGGASHVIVSGLSIGSNIDVDDGSLQNTAADADDTNGTPDDEDGISTFDILGDGTTSYSVEVDVTNTPGNAANLVGWIDFDGDGQFESSEASDIISNITTSGTETLTWSNLDTLPDGITVGITYARFRLSTDTLDANSSTGAATDGEVEDYQIDIKNSISGTGGSDSLTGSTGDDIFIGGAGRDTLTGNGGDDCFYFNRTSDGIDLIENFDTNGDKIDFSSLFATGGELAGATISTDPIVDGYVEVIGVGSYTLIQVDFNPSDDASFDPEIHPYNKNVVLLENVDHNTIDASDFIF